MRERVWVEGTTRAEAWASSLWCAGMAQGFPPSPVDSKACGEISKSLGDALKPTLLCVLLARQVLHLFVNRTTLPYLGKAPNLQGSVQVHTAR